MLKTYFAVALRNLHREKIYAAINITGLALAIACGLILLLYVRSELTYDRHNTGYANIYRVANDYINRGNVGHRAISSPALAPLMLKEYPDLGDYVRFRKLDNTFRHGDVSQHWDDVMRADDNVFDVFTHQIVYGSFEGALDDPYSMAISETFARRYFGDKNPVGEFLQSDTVPFKVTAVFKDLPDNSHLQYSALMSMNLIRNAGWADNDLTVNDLFNIGVYTYFYLDTGISQQQLQKMLDNFYDTYMKEFGEQIDLTAKLYAQPLLEIHFDNRFLGDGLPTGNIFYVYGFVAVALFVLLIACINYTNLATARASRRAKEVGMRKILGAQRWQLVVQFLGESIFYSLMALTLGLVMVEMVNHFTPLSTWLGKERLLNVSEDADLALWLAGGAVAIGFVAGAYPALYLSAIAPLSSINSTKKPRHSLLNLRQALIFVQFFVTVSVVASTLLMVQQMQYIASKPLGYQAENRISIQLRGQEVIDKLSLIRNRLLTNPNVMGVAEASFVPGASVPVNVLEIENDEGLFERTGTYHFQASPDLVEVMGIDVLEGANMAAKTYTQGNGELLVNETLVQRMNWRNPLGKQVKRLGRVVGVVKDFHVSSLHEPIKPMLIRPFIASANTNPASSELYAPTRYIVASVAGQEIHRTIYDIQSVMQDMYPSGGFNLHFFDELLDAQYENENYLMKLTGVFSAVCLFISCLGLFGLAAFTTEQRTKEIGIRKVLGASTAQITSLLARYQMALVIIAGLIASTLSYIVMHNWLATFAYRTEIQFWIFIVAILAVALIAFFTIAAQSVKVAQANPIRALRYE